VSKRNQRRSRPPQRAKAHARWPVAAVIAAAAVVAVGLILLGRVQSTPGSTSVALPSTGNVKGDPAAPVTLEVWGDFQCPVCRQYVATVGRQVEDTLVAQGTVKEVWRNMAFIGQESVWAAEAAECANEQGQFWGYHDKLYAEQQGENRGYFSKSNLERFAADLKLDTGRFDPCLESDRYAAAIQGERAEGEAEGVHATPTLFVNGQKVAEGVPSYDDLRAAILAAARAATPTAAGKP
jgi:protein-disulfide isomerase